MGFIDAIKTVFNKYATFSGRARRAEYWNFFLFNFLVSSILSTFTTVFEGNKFFMVLSSLYSLAVLIPGLAVCWRRLHDIGKSGANWFFVFLPIVGWILLLVWLIRPGVSGPNQYGPDPKGGYFDADQKAPWEY